MFCGTVYKITNLVSGKIYIGQTRHSLKQRWRHHLHAALNGKLNGKLQQAIVKHGKESFTIGSIESGIVSIEELNAREAYYIQVYDTFKNGYNMTTGGDGYTVSEDTKRKLSLRNGWKHTEETKTKIGAKAVGRKHSAETKVKISKVLLGNKHSDPSIFKRINKQRTNTTVHDFIHEQYGRVSTNCAMLAKCFGLNNSHVHKVVSGKYTHTKGWRVDV